VVELITDAKRKDLFPAGRLDKDTEGLLLITNDGALAHRILSPTKHVDKTYFVRVTGKLSESLVHIFAEGIDIGEDGCKKKPARPAKLRILSKGNSEEFSGEFSEAELTICEGRFHQVKRMFHAVGHEVVYLKRISMGGLKLDETLKPGEYRPLTTAELEQLEKSPSEI
jgi:16S rRNA pseudouridine516 synthase